MINGSLLPIFFHNDSPLPTGGTFFAGKYFALRYFSNYMPPTRSGLPLDPRFTDDVEFLLGVDTDVEFLLEINTQINLELGIYTVSELELETNRQLEFTIER